MVMFTNNSLTKVLLVAGMIFLINQSITAQKKASENQFRPYFQAGINGGSSLFFGDIKQFKYWPASGPINELQFAGGIYFKYQISPAFGLRLNGMYGQLAGMRKEWNLYFENDYIETNINTTLNFSNIFGHVRTDRFLDVYGTIGVGLLQYNTVVKSYYENTELVKVGYGNGKGINGRTFQGTMLYGLGLDFRLNGRFNLQLESTNRVLDSDMLDGRESGYPLDYFNYTSVGISYKLGFLKSKATPVEIPVEETVLYEPVQVEEPVVVEETPSEQAELLTEESIAIEPPAAYKAEEEIEEEIPGLEYRVQILARFEGPLTLKYISTTYIIPMYELSEDDYQGHIIYTVGSYPTYREARKKRDELRSLFGIKDAFVVAFDKGSRLNQLPDTE